MANIDSPFGLRPVRSLTGAPLTANRYCILAADGTATFKGDLVKLAGSAHTDGTPAVIQAAAGDAAVGVIVGFEPNYANLSLNYRLASTFRYCYVVDDPNAIFEIQEDSVGDTLVADDVAMNGDVTVAAGNTTTGVSGMELDSSNAHAADAGGQLRVLRLVPRVDNEIGANAKWEVMIAEHQLNGATDV